MSELLAATKTVASVKYVNHWKTGPRCRLFGGVTLLWLFMPLFSVCFGYCYRRDIILSRQVGPREFPSFRLTPCISRVAAASEDGLTWSESKSVTGQPAAPYAFIARGLWVRDGQLLALAAHFKGKGAFGVDKELELRAYRWDERSGTWQ